MVFSSLRRNKETILYFIVSILLLETVRVQYNRLSREDRVGPTVKKKRRGPQALLVKASLAYAVFLSWILFDYFTTLSGKITAVYPQAQYLKTNTALVLNGFLSYLLTVSLLKFLLELYITRMNEAFGFWKKLGRSTLDGTKALVNAPLRAGNAVKDKLVDGVRSGSEKVKDTATIGAYAVGRVPENIKEAARDKENWKYDELIAKISQLGVPALVLVVAVEITGVVGAAAVVEGLALLGGPLGLIGGLGILGLLVVISKGIGRYGFKAVFEGVLKNLYKKGHSREDILKKIDGYKITQRMKNSLRKYVEELERPRG
ncbi:MAG: hypothetical protein WC450_06695 [Candidatus Omnitrophota bacterium]|jgi:hypothetical protein